MKKNSNISGFAIIEVMIAIFIFSMGMASIFMVINSSISINTLNKNQIIASNLSMEAVEIIRNIRDSNYETYHKYNWIPNSSNDYTKLFMSGTYYTLENDSSSINYPFVIDEITFFKEGKSHVSNGDMDNYKLCIKKDTNIYSHICNSDDNNNIRFYRYLHLEELKDNSGNIIPDTMKLKSKVIWYEKGYHEFEINTILADFNRL